MRPLVPVLVAAALAAGCLGAGDAVEEGGQELPGAAAAAVAHRAGVLVPLPDGAGVESLRADVFGTGYRRGEPTVGLTSDGILFATGAQRFPVPLDAPGTQGGLVARSLDGGRTWDVVQDLSRNGKVDVDPWLWVDPATDRLYSAPLYAACSWSVWSEDRGQTWDGNPLAGCGLPAHDHQKLTGGPPPQGTTTRGYPSVLYYAYNSMRGDGGTFVSVSLDGGRTYGLPVEVHPADDCQAGINGPVAVAADGTAYLPKPTCDGPAVAVSRDGGASWSAPVVVPEAGMADHLVTLHAAVDEAGTAYVAWTGADELLHLSHTRDQGATWSKPVVASVPGARSVVFSAVAAGGPGRVGLGYVATDSDPATWPAMDPSVAPDSAVWHAYLAVSLDADAAEPTFTALRLTGDDDPVQRGCVWLGGGANPCRNLRDFVDVQHTGGRLVFAYADGCAACPDAASRTALGETVVAVQQGGPSLRDGVLPGPLDRTVPLPPAQRPSLLGPSRVV